MEKSHPLDSALLQGKQNSGVCRERETEKGGGRVDKAERERQRKGQRRKRDVCRGGKECV